MVPRALTIASSDSGGGAGIQADLKAFAAAGCHGMSAIVALTAQNTVGVTAIHEVPPEFVQAQLDAVFDDIGVDAAKTGMLFSAQLIEAVAEGLSPTTCPVGRRSRDGRQLRRAAVARGRRGRARDEVVPACDDRDPELRRSDRARRAGRRRTSRHAGSSSSAPPRRSSPVAATAITSSTARRRSTIPVRRHDSGATHGSGCTHSATLAALLARGEDLLTAATIAAATASDAVEHGLAELGSGEGPVDVFHLKGAR